MKYDIVKIIHTLCALAVTGSLLIAPWLSYQLRKCQPHTNNKLLLLKGLEFTDKYYNIAGWHRIFEAWFVLSVTIFIIDSLAEKSGAIQQTKLSFRWNQMKKTGSVKQKNYIKP